MKKNYFVIALVFLVVFLLSKPAKAGSESIYKFVVDIQIKKSAEIVVTESIGYDFGQNNRHGIYRYIPLTYKSNWWSRKIDIEVLSVERDGKNEVYSVSRKPGSIMIKIGRSDVVITGKHNYKIVYRVKDIFSYGKKLDELNLNAIGTGWSVPIKQAQVNIYLPAGLKYESVNCYQGKAGSTTPCFLAGSDGGVVKMEAKGVLSPNEGMTVLLSFAKQMIDEPPLAAKLFSAVKENIFVLVPFVFLVGMFLIWRRYGRDPQGRGNIIPQYEPPENLTPLLVGSLVDEKVDGRDFTAAFIYLAQQGFLAIERVEKGKWFKQIDYILRLRKNISRIPSSLERKLLVALFGEAGTEGDSVTLSDLRKSISFGKKIKQLKKSINKEMVKLGFFSNNPMKVRNNFILGGYLISFFAIFLFGYDIMLAISLFISGYIVIIFGVFMPRKTKYGALLKEHILGFKEFLTVTDKERFKFHNAPAKNPQQFMKYLPYAIALGVEKEWARQFADIYIDNPDWYKGNVSYSTASGLVDDLSYFSAVVGGLGFSGSGGSGGGGVGGGGGGGGGGSW